MRPLSYPRPFSTRIVIAVAALCLAISVLIGQEPQRSAKPKDLDVQARSAAAGPDMDVT